MKSITGTTWPGKPITWQRGDQTYISIPFTWNLPEVRERLLNGDLYSDKKAIVGGPAVSLLPKFLADVAIIGGAAPGMLQRVNPLATRTTVGCPRACGFCGVSTIEPEYRELADWPDGSIICDNNLLAASRAHVNRVMDRLKHHHGVDFNQGLDARLLERWHAERLAELDATIRLSWDYPDEEKYIVRALTYLRMAGIPRKRIRVYMLINFRETQEEALYRAQVLYYGLGVTPFPMRFNPLDTLERDSYVSGFWTDQALTRFMRYWGNLAGGTAKVPFEEFR